MPNPLTESLHKGWTLVRNNPQIFFTVFVAIIIVLGFLFTSQVFVEIVVDTQERFERFRVSSMHDAFVPLAEENIETPGILMSVMRDIQANNETIEDFRVLKDIDGERVIIASVKEGEVGFPDPEEDAIYQFTYIDPEQSFNIETIVGNDRVFKTLRAVTDGDDVVGWVFTSASLSQFDQLTNQSIRTAYIVLAGILLVILALLIRHARIIDYTTLYKRLKEVDQMKDDFVSMASHELRTPLTSIRGYADLVTGGGRLSDKDMENMRRIEISAKQLDELVNDILDVSRLEQGRMKFEFSDVDINQVIQDVIESLKPVANQKSLGLLFEKGEVGTYKLDPGRFKQIVTNLVGNAIKYTPKGEVKVISKKEGEKIYIRVSDTGIGLTAEEQKNLFKKFYRVKNEDTQGIRGTGLGLWISGEIIRQMNGSISVESIKGTGSHFIIAFPG